MVDLITRFKDKVMNLQFEQRRILANFCGGLALLFIAHLIFVRPGVFNVIIGITTAIGLLNIAIVFTKKGDNDV